MGVGWRPPTCEAFPAQDPAAHKGALGTSGRRRIGGQDRCGGLATLKFQRIGAGLVTLATPASLNDILEVKLTGR
jgi:NAD(P)H-hydrate repair Nnr-like enzyme with NAD(P)H-hydrate dehydratase domain